MTRYVALLRAVNVGGTGKLPMADLRAMGAEAGFADLSTYIASGNLLLTSDGDAPAVRAALETRLAARAGRHIPVLVRTADQMRAIATANPFAQHPGNRVAVCFLDAAPPADAPDTALHRTTEDIALGLREIYVHYPDGMGRSRLRVPAAEAGTVRNMNTVEKLAALLGTDGQGG